MGVGSGVCGELRGDVVCWSEGRGGRRGFGVGAVHAIAYSLRQLPSAGDAGGILLSWACRSKWRRGGEERVLG